MFIHLFRNCLILCIVTYCVSRNRFKKKSSLLSLFFHFISYSPFLTNVGTAVILYHFSIVSLLLVLHFRQILCHIIYIYICVYIYIYTSILYVYVCTYIQVSQEEGTKLRESVSYVKIYRYNPKHLYPKLNGYGVNGQRSLKL